MTAAGAPGRGGDRIRLAVPQDAEALGALVAKTLASAWSEETVARELEAPLTRVWLSVSESPARSAVLGYLVCHRVASELHVHAVGVLAPHRRQGIAARLFCEALEWAKKPGLEVICLEVAAGNAPALALYRSLGFMVVGARPRYYRNGEDALLLERPIDSSPGTPLAQRQCLEMTSTDAQPARIDALVVENRDEGGINRRLVVRADAWPPSRPGQFVMISAGTRSEVERSDPLLPRPMAIYRVRPSPGGVDLEILYKVSGRGTALLAAALPGQTVRVVGPLGQSFPDPGDLPGMRPILVGGGTGIASLFALAQRAVECAGSPGEVAVLLGAQTEVDLLGCEDFEALGITLYCVTEDGSRGKRGRVTDLLPDLLRDDGAVVFACGPTAMMQRCSEIADQHAVRCVVSLENTMACGFGVCLGCAAPVGEKGYLLVCCEGPVFEAGSVRWSEMP